MLPDKFKTMDDAYDWCKKLRRSLQEEQGARVADFPIYLNIYTKSVENTNWTNSAVLDTGIGAGYGLLIIRESMWAVTGIFKMDDQTLTIVSADILFTTVKDTAGSYNVYWEGTSFKVQNKVGNNRNVRVLYYGD
jgi:hypothetical protein